MKLTRPNPPQFLKDNWKKWSKRYAENRAKAIKDGKTPPEFQWAKFKGKRVNEHLMPIFNNINKQHCSYCDNFPVGKGDYVSLGQNSIDHFRPKSEFPLLSYHWANLFLSCDRCQNNKLEKFCKHWLKPDKIDYDFDKYFLVNFKTGALQPNKTASRHDQMKALLTIRVFRLDTPEMRKSRLLEYKKFTKNIDIENFAFRYFLRDKF
jgi:uncharacterized protein (TIGR02646 family)